MMIMRINRDLESGMRARFVRRQVVNETIDAAGSSSAFCSFLRSQLLNDTIDRRASTRQNR